MEIMDDDGYTEFYYVNLIFYKFKIFNKPDFS